MSDEKAILRVEGLTVEYGALIALPCDWSVAPMSPRHHRLSGAERELLFCASTGRHAGNLPTTPDVCQQDLRTPSRGRRTSKELVPRGLTVLQNAVASMPVVLSQSPTSLFMPWREILASPPAERSATSPVVLPPTTTKLLGGRPLACSDCCQCTATDGREVLLSTTRRRGPGGGDSEGHDVLVACASVTSRS
jgi:hypothetical protein